MSKTSKEQENGAYNRAKTDPNPPQSDTKETNNPRNLPKCLKTKNEQILKKYNPDSQILSTKLRTLRYVIVFSALLGFLVIDFFRHEDFMQLSCKVTSKLQKIVWCEILSKVLSSILTYWVIALFAYLKFFNFDVRFLLWVMIVWAIPITLAALMKATWARGRPFFHCPAGSFEIWKCVSEFGFPSSHATMGISVYYILYKTLERHIQGKKIWVHFFGFFVGFFYVLING